MDKPPRHARRMPARRRTRMTVAGKVEAAAPPATGAPLGALRQRALSLGGANAYDAAMQFLLPVVLARCLDPSAFGQYRLLWLVVTTVISLATMSMPQSLYYFLPRSGAAARRLYVHQTMLFLAVVGLVGGFAVSPWNPWLPAGVRPLLQFGALVPALVLLWSIACLLDMLPNIEERVGLQARFIMSLSTLRSVSLAAAAYFTGDLQVVVWLLVALFLFKVLLLVGYIARSHGLGPPWFSWASFLDQFRHAAPFGISSALYGLRGQADQWVAASLFALHSFAAFSIAAVLGPLVNLFRYSVNHAFLPSMSRMHAADDIPSMLALNSRANIMVAALVYPVLAFAFAFAEDIVTAVYTGTYVEGGVVMRVYILGLLAFVVELVSIMLMLREGKYALRVNLVLLGLAVALSWIGARSIGLAGAAVGSVLVIYLDRFANLLRIGARTGIALSRLQDWRTLGMLLAFATLAALTAWLAVTQYPTTAGTMPRLAFGAGVMAAAYLALPALFGLGWGWLAKVCDPDG